MIKNKILDTQIIFKILKKVKNIFSFQISFCFIKLKK